MRLDKLNKGVNVNREENQSVIPGACQHREVVRRGESVKESGKEQLVRLEETRKVRCPGKQVKFEYISGRSE